MAETSLRKLGPVVVLGFVCGLASGAAPGPGGTPAAPSSPPAAAAAAAALAAAAPDAVFAARHLTKVGFLLEIPQEAEVRRTAASLRALKLRVANEGIARAAMDRAVTAANDNLIATESRLTSIHAQLKSMEHDADPSNYNALVGPHNELVQQERQQYAKLEALRKRQAAQEDSSPAYNAAALEAAGVADAATEAYDALAQDAELKAAMDAFNRTATVPLKLGPSGAFQEDVAFIRKCATDAAAAAIPFETPHGVPELPVLLNGKLTQTMIWDSGASGVSLSMETANKLGLRPTASDQTVTATVADGRKVDSKVMTLDSITVGPYTVEHVPCEVATQAGGVDLLGDDFQQHFLCRLDMQAGQLHLTPLPGQQGVKMGRPTTAAAGRELLMAMMGRAAATHPDGSIVLIEGDRIHTPDSYRPPVTFHVEAQTNSTNIRLGYGADEIIFDWDRDPHQLRVNGGPAAGRHKAGAGYIPPNTWADIQLVVRPDALTVLVDGRERYTAKADFSKVNQPLTIFQAGGATVKVRSVRVVKE